MTNLNDLFFILFWLGICIIDFILGTLIGIKNNSFNNKLVLKWFYKIFTHLIFIFIVSLLFYSLSVKLPLLSESVAIGLIDSFIFILLIIELNSVIYNCKVLNIPIPKIFIVLVDDIQNIVNDRFKSVFGKDSKISKEIDYNI